MPTTPPDLSEMDPDDRVQAMVEWFSSNFVDPAMETPYDGGEGGYQYIWGGPFDAEEEIVGAFPDATQEEIQEAVDEVQSDGIYEWAPVGPPDDYFDEPDVDEERAPRPEDEVEVPLPERLASLAAQLDRIEEHVAYWRDRPAGIGHNNPPNEFNIPPDDPELAEVAESVEEVRGELAKADPGGADVEVLQRAEGRFAAFAGRIRKWLIAAGTIVGGAILEGIGNKVGEGLVDDPSAFMSVLEGAAVNIGNWVTSIWVW